MLFCSQVSEYTDPPRSPCPGGSAGSTVMERTGSRRKSRAEVVPCWLVWAGSVQKPQLALGLWSTPGDHWESGGGTSRTTKGLKLAHVAMYWHIRNTKKLKLKVVGRNTLPETACTGSNKLLRCSEIQWCTVHNLCTSRNQASQSLCVETHGVLHLQFLVSTGMLHGFKQEPPTKSHRGLCFLILLYRTMALAIWWLMSHLFWLKWNPNKWPYWKFYL